MRILQILSLGICVLSAAAASAVSDLTECSLDGVTVAADVVVGYDGVGSIGLDFTPGNDIRPPIVFPVSSADTASAVANAVPLGGGLLKDEVEGRMKASFEFGTPFGTAPQDTLQLEASGNASAVESKNSAGNMADATVQGDARATFEINIVTGKDCDTFLNLPAVRSLLPFELFLEINVIIDPGLPGQAVLATLGPGSPADTVLLPEDHFYLIQLDYDYRVPFANDPPFLFDYPITFGASAVPLLGPRGGIALGLLLLGTAALAARRSWTGSLSTR